jgi:hypothetical protein
MFGRVHCARLRSAPSKVPATISAKMFSSDSDIDFEAWSFPKAMEVKLSGDFFDLLAYSLHQRLAASEEIWTADIFFQVIELILQLELLSRNRKWRPNAAPVFPIHLDFAYAEALIESTFSQRLCTERRALAHFSLRRHF